MSSAQTAGAPDGASEPRVFPHSGVCTYCHRDRDDLFWHRYDDTFYCVDVWRCEARYEIQARKWMADNARPQGADHRGVPA